MASYGKPCDDFLEFMVYLMQMIEAEHEKSDQIILHHKVSTKGPQWELLFFLNVLLNLRCLFDCVIGC